MINLFEILNSTEVQQYSNRVFSDLPGTPIDKAIFLLVSVIVGFAAITWRYVINPKDDREYARWKKEDTATKIFLSLVIGFMGYVAVIILSEFVGAFNFLISGKEILIFKDHLNIGVLVCAVFYTLIFLLSLGRNQLSPYKDLQKFALLHIYIIPIFGIMAASFVVMRFNFGFGIILFLFALIFVGFFISALFNKPKK
jgi:hypothetical protein